MVCAYTKGNNDDLALIFLSFVVLIDSAETKGHLHKHWFINIRVENISKNIKGLLNQAGLPKCAIASNM